MILVYLFRLIPRLCKHFSINTPVELIQLDRRNIQKSVMTLIRQQLTQYVTKRKARFHSQVVQVPNFLYIFENCFHVNVFQKRRTNVFRFNWQNKNNLLIFQGQETVFHTFGMCLHWDQNKVKSISNFIRNSIASSWFFFFFLPGTKYTDSQLTASLFVHVFRVINFSDGGKLFTRPRNTLLKHQSPW